MVGLFLEIVPMFVAKGFARRRFVAQINADMIPARTYAHFGALSISCPCFQWQLLCKGWQGVKII